MRVPGIGTMSGAWCSSQASASWAGVRSSSAASSRSGAKRSRLAARFCGLKRGWLERKFVPDLVRRAGEEAGAERRPRHEADAELLQHRQQLALGVARPQRVLALDRGERVHLVGGDDLLGGDVGEPEVADLALASRARPSRRSTPRPARPGRGSAGTRGRARRRRAAAGWPRRPRGRAPGRASIRIVLGVRVLHGRPPSKTMPHLVASWTVAALDRAADEPLVRARGVGVGGVDHGRAGVDRVPQRRQRALVVGVAVHAVDQGHRAEADGRGGQWAEVPGLHALDRPRGGARAATGPAAVPAIGFTDGGDRARQPTSSAPCATARRIASRILLASVPNG